MPHEQTLLTTLPRPAAAAAHKSALREAETRMSYVATNLADWRTCARRSCLPGAGLTVLRWCALPAQAGPSLLTVQSASN
jgi:hypothetical protein